MNAKCILYSMVILIIGGCASNRDLDTLKERVNWMELDLKQRQNAIQSKTDEVFTQQEGTFRSQHAEMRVNLENIRNELQSMSGRLEEVEHIFQGKGASGGLASGEKAGRIDSMEEMLNSNLQRIVRLEEYVGLDPSEIKPPAGEAQGLRPAKPDEGLNEDLNEDGLYEYARQHFNQGNMEKAREGFARLLKQFPKSKYAGNAQFWIGETFYQEKWYEKAILEYQKVIENYRDGNKLQAAFLKQGLAFHLLGENPNARLILKELIRKYPKSNEAKIAEQKLKDIK